MHRTQPRIRQRHPAEQTRHRHVGPRTRVPSIGPRRPQRPARAPHPLFAKGIRHRIRAQTNIRFDQLRQRIQPGTGCQGRWQIESQLRIHQRDGGQKKRTAQTDLDPMLRRSQHRVARNLRAGASGRGNRHERRRRLRNRLPPPNNLQIIQQIPYSLSSPPSPSLASSTLPPPMLTTKRTSSRATATPAAHIPTRLPADRKSNHPHPPPSPKPPTVQSVPNPVPPLRPPPQLSGQPPRLQPCSVAQQSAPSISGRGKYGVFQDANEACAAAHEALFCSCARKVWRRARR